MVLAMTTEPLTAKEIFVELIGNVVPDRWEERLAEACAGDAELEHRVRALLRAHAEPGSFLDQPAVAADGTASCESSTIERPGVVIGPYKLLEQIGEGGFAVVFMAEQTAPGRLSVRCRTSARRRHFIAPLHGYTLNRGFQMTYSGMNAVAEREGFLVAYPDAVNGDWFGPQDNIGFIDRVLDDVSSQYAVNARKIYATGFSQGGMMSYLLSVELSDRLAAIASVGGIRPLDSGDILAPPNIEPTPSRRFPVLHIHGTGDPIVPYNGGISTVGSLTLNFPPRAAFGSRLRSK